MPRSRSTDRRFYGLVTGIVAEPRKEDPPSPEGRIPVSLRWYDKSFVLPRCRVAQLYAGNGFGAFWKPEVGTEVTLAFIQGDMRDPIVLGGLYNGKDRPGATAPAKGDDKKVLVTKGEHQIVFDDKAQSITVATKSGTSVTLDGKGSQVTIAADTKITIKARDIEIVADGGDVTVSGTTIRLN
jgi:uncharacterized protein involved in type VI secretion and phage assembly